jgi:two-component system C4-dicarboxylate transport response regulator DctD
MNKLGQVLFVDDEAAMRHAVTQWLALAGFEVVVEETASAALSKLTKGFPGILVTDLRMDGLSGIDLLRLSHELDPELPVIIITGHGGAETAVEVTQLGAFAFIEKPFAPECLLEAVQRASETRRVVLERRHLHRVEDEQGVSGGAVNAARVFPGGVDSSADLDRSRTGRSA